MRGRWAQGLEPRVLLLDHQGPARGVGAPGRVRAEPPQGAAPGGADLARSATASRASLSMLDSPHNLHAYDEAGIAVRARAARPPRRAGPTRLPRASTRTLARWLDDPQRAGADPPRGVRRPAARRARRATSSTRASSPRGRTRSSSSRRSPAASSARSGARSSRSRSTSASSAIRRRAHGPELSHGHDRHHGAARARGARRAPRGADAPAAVRGRRRARRSTSTPRARATTSTTPSTTPRSPRRSAGS